MNENLNIKQENGSMTFTSCVVFVRFNFNQDRDKKNPDFDICVDKYTRTPKGRTIRKLMGGRAKYKKKIRAREN